MTARKFFIQTWPLLTLFLILFRSEFCSPPTHTFFCKPVNLALLYLQIIMFLKLQNPILGFSFWDMEVQFLISLLHLVPQRHKSILHHLPCYWKEIWYSPYSSLQHGHDANLQGKTWQDLTLTTISHSKSKRWYSFQIQIISCVLAHPL